MPLIIFALLFAEGVDPKIVEPAISTLAQTILGSLVILSLVVAGLSIWQLIKIQNLRVEDEKVRNARIAELYEKALAAMTGLQGALEGLRRSEENSQVVLQGMKTTFDMFVLMRQFRPTPGAIPAVNPEKPK